jgi:signal transduction histidine kinase
MVRKVAVDLGLDLHALVDGLRVPVHELERPSEGCRWDDFASLCDRLHAVLGDEGMLAAGRRFLEIPKVAAFARIGAAFATPRSLYRMGVRYSPSTFTVVSAQLTERSPVEVDVELVVRPDARDSRGFFVFNAGVLAAMPRMIGLSDAVVEARYEQRRGQYRVIHPPSRSVWTRLRHLFIALTSARHAYDELQAHNEALLTRLQELEQARTLAETASTTKSRFMANVSHELRTPMNGVLGMIEVLDTTPLSAEQRGYLHSLRASADGLLEVIDGILDFSRLESSRLELARAPYDPARLLNELVLLLQQRAQGRGLVLRLRAAPTLPAVVVGDAERVRLVLHHLVRNAVTFTERGVVEVRAWADAQHLVFEVEDTGPGIDERWRAQLFRPFVQVDDSLTRRHGGSGLGLAICRQVVELMGGQIDYRSQVGVGSTFWFRIPRTDASAPECLCSAHARPRERGQPRPCAARAATPHAAAVVRLTAAAGLPIHVRAGPELAATHPARSGRPRRTSTHRRPHRRSPWRCRPSCACWSSTTTCSTSGCCCPCSSAWACGRMWPTTASSASRPMRRGPMTSSSWTARCRS